MLRSSSVRASGAMTTPLVSRHPAAPAVPPRVFAVVLDRSHARIFAVTARDVVEVKDISSPATRGGRFHSDRRGAPGGGEHTYHQRLEEESRRHFRAVCEALAAEIAGHAGDHVFIAGPGPMATVFRRHLPVDLSARVIGVEQLNPLETTPAIIAAAARDAERHHHREAEQAVMAAVAEGLGTGRATNGLRETLRALANGQVRTLVTQPHARGAGFRCLESGRLVVTAAECRGEGAPREVADIVRAAAREAVQRGAQVVVIEDPTVAREIDGLAALLRFP